MLVCLYTHTYTLDINVTPLQKILSTGLLAVVAQWQSTGGSSQRCPGFDSRRLPAFSFPLFSPHNTACVAYQGYNAGLLTKSPAKFYIEPAENNIAARKFDRSQCYRSELLLLSMTTLSLTPRSQSPVGELPWNQ